MDRDRDDQIVELLQGMRDDQQRHHAEWQNAVSLARREQAILAKKAEVEQRKGKLWMRGIFVVIAAAVILPMVMQYFAMRKYRNLDNLAANPQSVESFDGRYSLDVEASFPEKLSEIEAAEGDRKDQLKELLQIQTDQFEYFEIRRGIIRSGKDVVQEFILTKTDLSGNTLEASALWHEDMYDPGDCSIESIKLELDGETLRFFRGVDDQDFGPPLVFKRLTH